MESFRTRLGFTPAPSNSAPGWFSSGRLCGEHLRRSGVMTPAEPCPLQPLALAGGGPWEPCTMLENDPPQTQTFRSPSPQTPTFRSPSPPTPTFRSPSPPTPMFRSPSHRPNRTPSQRTRDPARFGGRWTFICLRSHSGVRDDGAIERGVHRGGRRRGVGRSRRRTRGRSGSRRIDAGLGGGRGRPRG